MQRERPAIFRQLCETTARLETHMKNMQVVISYRRNTLAFLIAGLSTSTVLHPLTRIYFVFHQPRARTTSPLPLPPHRTLSSRCKTAASSCCRRGTASGGATRPYGSPAIWCARGPSTRRAVQGAARSVYVNCGSPSSIARYRTTFPPPSTKNISPLHTLTKK